MRIIIATLHVRQSSQAVPLAAGCLKAGLPEPLRQTTELLDFYPDQADGFIIRTCLDRRADLIAFPLYGWNRHQVLRLSSQLRRMNPALILLAGGPEASADSRKVLSEGALDAVICGEGDQAFADYVTRRSKSQPTFGIEGLFEKTHQSALQAAVCPDLSKLSSPWLNGDLPLSPGCGVLWEVARGCHFNCAFCYDAKGHRGVRPLPFERLEQELELFVEKQVSQIWVLDSTFNAPRGRGKKLLELLLTKAPRIHYHIEAKADLLDDETIELLAQLSCSIQLGLQSANPDVLRPLRRKLDPQRMKSRLSELSRAGLTFGLDLIYGLPGDNHDGFINSLNFALDQQPNQVDIFPLAILPGTELFHHSEAFHVQGQPSPPYLVEENATYSSADLEKSRELAALTDIFYNRGRAVGFFRQVCRALKQTPAAFLQEFGRWLQREKGLSQNRILDVESWQPADILSFQLEFITGLLRNHNRDRLIALSQDLVRYHYCCAEVLLTEDCRPAEYPPGERKTLNTRWKLHSGVRMASFHYSLDDLESRGGEPLEVIARQLKSDPSEVIFFRQGEEIIIESLDDDFARLLRKAQNPERGKDLVGNPATHDAQDQLLFAISQGLLIPVI